jgi:AcrR family transcriptional regulator
MEISGYNENGSLDINRDLEFCNMPGHTNPEVRAGPGRRRSEPTRLAILDAAYDLVLRKGYTAVTMAEIAAAAGAGKQTIYRWWVSKPALVLDALQHRGEIEIDPEFPLDQPLSSFFRRVCAAATRAGPVLRSLMAEAQFDTALRAELKTRLIERRRDAFRRTLIRAGISDPRQREALVLALYGAVWYRLLLDEPLDDTFVDAMIELARPSGS